MEVWGCSVLLGLYVINITIASMRRWGFGDRLDLRLVSKRLVDHVLTPVACIAGAGGRFPPPE